MTGPVLNGEGFSVSFSDREVTAWGGLALMKRMLDSMEFRLAVCDWSLPAPGSNRGYAPVQVIEQFIVSIRCGACRFMHAETVRMDSTLTRLFGWSRAAGHQAVMRLFAGFATLSNEQVRARAYRCFFDKIGALKPVALDVDSTVITRNDEQEGAAHSANNMLQFSRIKAASSGRQTCRTGASGQRVLRRCRPVSPGEQGHRVHRRSPTDANAATNGLSG